MVPDVLSFLRGVPMKHAICILAVVGAFMLVPLSWADTFTPYTLSGTITWQGNDACGGTCVEQVSYSLPLTGIYETQYGEYLLEQNGPGTVDASGPLGAAVVGYSPDHYVAIDWPAGQQEFTELDLFISFDTDFFGAKHSLGPYTVPADVWSCFGPCVTDFCPPNAFACPAAGYPFGFKGTNFSILTPVNPRPVITPEPASFALLAGGLLLLFARRSHSSAIISVEERGLREMEILRD